MSKVTIIIANHNNDKYIEECIYSCFNQSVPVNVAVCDDASTDKSQQILKKYKNKKQIDFIWNQENLGPSASRNKLITRHIDSDFFAILDADDLMMPNKIERMLTVLSNNPAIGVAYADYYHMYNDGSVMPEFKQSFSRMKLVRNSIVHSGFMVTKECLLANKINDEEFYDNSFRVCEDWDLTLRLSRSHAIVHIPEFLTKVRITGNNSSDYVDSSIWQSSWMKIGERLQNGYYN